MFKLLTLALLISSATAFAATPERQAEVATRGAHVMPFTLDATTHLFAKLTDGGVQQVTTKQPDDQAQIELIRQHLKEITDQFSHRDFSSPHQIHGVNMPGLATLTDAPKGSWSAQYAELINGAEVRYRSIDPQLVEAIHDWFDAQLSDHGHHATGEPGSSKPAHGKHDSSMHHEHKHHD